MRYDVRYFPTTVNGRQASEGAAGASAGALTDWIRADSAAARPGSGRWSGT